MTLTTLIVGAGVFYFIIWFFDSFFKSCMHYPYYAFLEGTGLKFGIFNFSWHTTAFNRLIFKWSQRGTTFLRKWFAAGTFTSLVLLPIAIIIVLLSILKYVQPTSENGQHGEPVLEVVIPGLNMPSEDAVHYLVALVISSVVHELGHAMAAVLEDVQLKAIGFYVVTIIPMAYVELNTEQLVSLNYWRKFRIFCAGIWHNITCAVVAYLLLVSCPSLFKLGYKSGVGVEVHYLHPSSPIQGDRGLNMNDIITDINDCTLKYKQDWSTCLTQVTINKFGLCVSADFVAKNDESVKVSYKDDIVNCCLLDHTQNICFEYIEPPHGMVSLSQYSCLSPREMLKSSSEKCYARESYVCPEGLHCLRPILTNTTNLMILERREKDKVLYLGLPSDIYGTVRVSHYIPRYNSFPSNIPENFEKLLKYVIMFSLGLAFINVLPCYCFDGQHIMKTLVCLVSKHFNKNAQFAQSVTFCIILLGTLLTFPLLILGFLNVLYTAYWN